jgi:flagellar hook assembly protein FlgD
VAFDLPGTQRARARVVNATGALVKTLIDAPIAAGSHEVSWEGTDDAGRRVAQGVYMLRLETESLSATRKLVLTR